MIPKLICWLFGHDDLEEIKSGDKKGWYRESKTCIRCGIELKEGSLKIK